MRGKDITEKALENYNEVFFKISLCKFALKDTEYHNMSKIVLEYTSPICSTINNALKSSSSNSLSSCIPQNTWRSL